MKAELPPFEERLKAFVVTELAGLLMAIANDKFEVEQAVEDLLQDEIRSMYGEWA